MKLPQCTILDVEYNTMCNTRGYWAVIAQWYSAGLSIKRLCFRIPPMAKIKFLSCAHSPGLLCQFGKMSTDFGSRVSSTELELKIRVYVLRSLAVVSDCTGALVENDTRPARHKQYTHGHRICPPHRTTLL